MNTNNKSEYAYKTIGEVTRELGLINKKTGHLQTHTIRYWETQFKQIKSTIKAGKRRYYSARTFKIIKYIKFLLKERGLTINGAKKILNKTKTHTLDEDMNIGINKLDLHTTLRINNLHAGALSAGFSKREAIINMRLSICIGIDLCGCLLGSELACAFGTSCVIFVGGFK